MKKNLLLFAIFLSIISSSSLYSQITNSSACSTNGKNPLKMTISSDNLFAYVISSAEIIIYQRNQTNGQLSFLSSLNQMSSGNSLSNIFYIALSPDGKFIYVEGATKAYIFKRNFVTGILTPFQTIDYYFSPSLMPISSSNIVCSKDNKSVYFSGRAHVYIFRRDPVSDSLFNVENVYNVNNITNTSVDISMELSPDDSKMFITGEHSVSVYSRDTTNGKLTFRSIITGDNFNNNGLTYSHESKMSNDGRFLYTVTISQGSGAIVILKMNYATDSLTIIQTIYNNLRPTYISKSNNDKSICISSGPTGFDSMMFFARDSISGCLFYVSKYENSLQYSYTKCFDKQNGYLYSCPVFVDSIYIYKLSSTLLVESINENAFSVSPNPFTSQTIIKSEQNKISTIRLYNLQGECIYYFECKNPESEVKVNSNGIAKGVYLIQITDEKQKYVMKKIIIQ